MSSLRFASTVAWLLPTAAMAQINLRGWHTQGQVFLVWFLFVESAFRFRFPSDSTSR